MLELRHKGQEARKALQIWQGLSSKSSRMATSTDSQWMNQAQRLRPHFWAYLQRGAGNRTHVDAAYGKPSDFGISLEVSFIERKKDEQT